MFKQLLYYYANHSRRIIKSLKYFNLQTFTHDLMIVTAFIDEGQWSGISGTPKIETEHI